MGSDEAERGVVTLKQMGVAHEAGIAITAHEDWKSARFGQREVARTDIVHDLKTLLGQD
jgi:hypothetical protein